MDRDAVRRKGALTSLLSRFASGELDVLVGTQMIAKGHDFPRVTLVGVISADVGLGMADFRAAERTFQLLTQVAGRSGRGEQPGEAIVQTLYPEHYSVQLACRQDYAAFFERELTYRKGLRYPPMVALVNAVVRGRSLEDATHVADLLAERIVKADASRQFHRAGTRARAADQAARRAPRAAVSQGITPRRHASGVAGSAGTDARGSAPRRRRCRPFECAVAAGLQTGPSTCRPERSRPRYVAAPGH